MTKSHFIALADAIREHNRTAHYQNKAVFTEDQINTLADFCKRENPAFKRGRWLAYIAGECGPNGGSVK